MLDISFIVPLYNQEKYILPCLESIVNAGLSADSYEIIVWNDGSTDSSEALVLQFMENHPTIKLVSEQNHGVSYARNQALRLAKGDYIWFVDSDDMVNSPIVKKLVNYALASKLDMLVFNWKSLLPDGREESGIHPLIDAPVQRGRDLYLENVITMAPWCFLYRREFLLKSKLKFPEDFKTCEDIQMNQQALFVANRVGMSSQVGYVYRHLHVSATKGKGNMVADDQIRRLNNEIEWFSQQDAPEYLQMVVYRNLREINVWLAWAEVDDHFFAMIKLVLKSYRVHSKFSFASLFILLMKYVPKPLYLLQRFVNRTRRKLNK